MSEILFDKLLQYTSDLTSDEGYVLKNLERTTYKDVLLFNMISGKV